MKSDGIDAWAVLTVVCAAAVAAPLIGLPLSFVVAPGSLSEFSGLVPEAAGATVVLVVGVGAGTPVLGTALAGGLSRGAAFGRGALPLARPAILGGVALALMEALADFGTVNLLGVRSFTDAIYRVWFGAFDRDAAMQLATLLLSVTLTLLMLERLARGRARHAQLAARGDAVRPVRLRGLAPAAGAPVARGPLGG